MADSGAGVLEQALKYSSVTAAVAYVTGFVMEIAYLSHLQPSFYDLDYSPRLLANGVEVLLLYAGAVLFGVVLMALSDSAKPMVRLLFKPSTGEEVLTSENKARYALLILCPVLALINLYHVHPSPEFSVQASLVMGNILLVAVLIFPRAYGRFTHVQKGAFVLVIAVALAILAFAVGTWAWDAPGGQGIVRLLVAPEAVAGVEELGVNFPGKDSAGSARLSNEVVMLYTGSRTYTFRLDNKQIVQLNKDKVWGMSRR